MFLAQRNFWRGQLSKKENHHLANQVASAVAEEIFDLMMKSRHEPHVFNSRLFANLPSGSGLIILPFFNMPFGKIPVFPVIQQ